MISNQQPRLINQFALNVEELILVNVYTEKEFVIAVVNQDTWRKIVEPRGQINNKESSNNREDNKECQRGFLH